MQQRVQTKGVGRKKQLSRKGPLRLVLDTGNQVRISTSDGREPKRASELRIVQDSDVVSLLEESHEDNKNLSSATHDSLWRITAVAPGHATLYLMPSGKGQATRCGSELDVEVRASISPSLAAEDEDVSREQWVPIAQAIGRLLSESLAENQQSRMLVEEVARLNSLLEVQISKSQAQSELTIDLLRETYQGVSLLEEWSSSRVLRLLGWLSPSRKIRARQEKTQQFLQSANVATSVSCQEYERVVGEQGFLPSAYLAFNPDVQASGVKPLRHYASIGKTETRRLG